MDEIFAVSVKCKLRSFVFVRVKNCEIVVK